MVTGRFLRSLSPSVRSVLDSVERRSQPQPPYYMLTHAEAKTEWRAEPVGRVVSPPISALFLLSSLLCLLADLVVSAAFPSFLLVGPARVACFRCRLLLLRSAACSPSLRLRPTRLVGLPPSAFPRAQGRSNLFQVLCLFVYYVKTRLKVGNVLWLLPCLQSITLALPRLFGFVGMVLLAIHISPLVLTKSSWLSSCCGCAGTDRAAHAVRLAFRRAFRVLPVVLCRFRLTFAQACRGSLCVACVPCAQDGQFAEQSGESRGHVTIRSKLSRAGNCAIETLSV